MALNSFARWPVYTEEEIEAVACVLRSGQVNYWTGNEVRQFEKEFSQWCGCEYGVAVANGTLALEGALMSVGVESGDEVIVTARSFIASASTIVIRGALPVFVDVDVNSQTISVDDVRAAITPRTKAIICVHLAGWPCDMDELRNIADENSLFLIEDCAQAHGAKYKGKSVGGLGHIAAWSFCQDKIMSTGGEGGMITTNDSELWSRVWSYKDHGKSWDAVYSNEQQLGFRWLHESIGTNWRMTEMQASIGRIQLNKMNDWHSARKQNAMMISEVCGRYQQSLRVTLPPSYIEHAWYKYYVFVHEKGLCEGWNRDRIMQSIVSEGVPCFSGSCPEIYLEKAFQSVNVQPKEHFPAAHELGKSSLMFLVHPTISDTDMQHMISVIDDVMHKATFG